MRISDWSSDVCSSDLAQACRRAANAASDSGHRANGKSALTPTPLPLRRRGAKAMRFQQPLSCEAGEGGAKRRVRVRLLLHTHSHARPTTPSPQPLSRSRSEEHTSELQSLMRISYAVFCLNNKQRNKHDK